MRLTTRLAVASLMALLPQVASAADGAPPPPTTLAEVGEVRPGVGFPKGFLAPAELPDSLALLPAPPAAGSSAQAADEAAASAGAAAGPARRGLAAVDASLDLAQIIAPFSNIVGVDIAGGDVPNLWMLVRRAATDAALATYRAKDHYQRQRPFMTRQTATCYPQDDAMLRRDGSYPSGHSALGWMIALVLVEVVPARTDALLARGREFGDSRAVCLAHWQSDVEAGRLVASATFARLQSDPLFQAQLQLARSELARLPAPAASAAAADPVN